MAWLTHMANTYGNTYGKHIWQTHMANTYGIMTIMTFVVFNYENVA